MNEDLITDNQLEAKLIKNITTCSGICISYDDFFVLKAMDVVEGHLTETDFDVSKFAELMAMSQSTLYRKSRLLLNLSPNEYIQHVRLDHAERLLKQKVANVTTIAYTVGFSDPKYFARCFKQHYGFNPSDILRMKINPDGYRRTAPEARFHSNSTTQVDQFLSGLTIRMYPKQEDSE